MKRNHWGYKTQNRKSFGYRKSYRIKKTRPFWSHKIFWLCFFCTGALGGILYFFIFSSFFQVQAMEISGLSKIPFDNFKTVVEKNIQKNFIFFSFDNIILADLKKASKAAFNEFPQLEDIKIKRKFPGTIVVSAEEKKPVAILTFIDRHFFLDKKGIVFEETTETKNELPNIAIEGINENPNLGEKVIDESRILKILDINNKLKAELQLEPHIFRSAGDNKLIVKTKENWEFYLNLESDIDWQLAKLSVVLQQKIPQERRRDLEYIELRFGNFAPYKYR